MSSFCTSVSDAKMLTYHLVCCAFAVITNKKSRVRDSLTLLLLFYNATAKTL